MSARLRGELHELCVGEATRPREVRQALATDCDLRTARIDAQTCDKLTTVHQLHSDSIGDVHHDSLLPYVWASIRQGVPTIEGSVGHVTAWMKSSSQCTFFSWRRVRQRLDAN